MIGVKHFIGIFIAITGVVGRCEISARSILISSKQPTPKSIQIQNPWNANGYEYIRTINVGRSIFQPPSVIMSPYPYLRSTGTAMQMQMPTFDAFNQGRSEPFQAQPPMTQLPQPFPAYRSNLFRHVDVIADPSYYYYRSALPMPVPPAPSQTIYFVRNPVYMSRGFFDNFLSFFGISSKDSEVSESVHDESKEPKPNPEASPAENEPTGNASILQPEVKPEKKPEAVSEETITIKEVTAQPNFSVQPLPPMDNNGDGIHEPETEAPDKTKVQAAVPDQVTTDDLPVSAISFTSTETCSEGLSTPLTDAEAELPGTEPVIKCEPEITELTSVIESESEISDIESEPEIPENEIPQETQATSVVENKLPDAAVGFKETTDQEPSAIETAVNMTSLSTEKPDKAVNVSTVEGSKPIEDSVKPEEKIRPVDSTTMEEVAPMGAKNTTSGLGEKASTTTENVDVRPQEVAVTTDNDKPLVPTTSPTVEDFNVIPEP